MKISYINLYCKICKVVTKHEKIVDATSYPVYESEWFCVVCESKEREKIEQQDFLTDYNNEMYWEQQKGR